MARTAKGEKMREGKIAQGSVEYDVEGTCLTVLVTEPRGGGRHYIIANHEDTRSIEVDTHELRQLLEWFGWFLNRETKGGRHHG
jgi:hypothetical protein